jgi:hypothetical protein
VKLDTDPARDWLFRLGFTGESSTMELIPSTITKLCVDVLLLGVALAMEGPFDLEYGRFVVDPRFLDDLLTEGALSVLTDPGPTRSAHGPDLSRPNDNRASAHLECTLIPLIRSKTLSK